MELQLFRLTILVVVVSVVGFGSYSGYSFYRAMGWQELVQDNEKRFEKAVVDCDKEGNSPHVWCESKTYWKEQSDYAASVRDDYSEQAELTLRLSWVVPLLSLFIFYSLRWVIRGKLFPLLPRNDQ